MEREKEKSFKVTDKRAAFQEDAAETSPQESSPTAAPQDAASQETQSQEQATETDSSPLLPEASFTTLVLSLYTYAQMSLGVVPDPVTQKIYKDIHQAKYNIDLLAILQEKTRGNLTKEEEQMLEQILFEIRMVYVEACKTA